MCIVTLTWVLLVFLVFWYIYIYISLSLCLSVCLSVSLCFFFLFLSLSLYFNGHLSRCFHFPVWILLQLRMMEVVVPTGAVRTVRCAKLQSNRHRQQTNTQLFTGRMPFLLSGHHKWRASITLHGLAHAKLVCGLSALSLFAKSCLWTRRRLEDPQVSLGWGSSTFPFGALTMLLVIHAEHVVQSAWILFWLWMYVCLYVCMLVL